MMLRSLVLSCFVLTIAPNLSLLYRTAAPPAPPVAAEPEAPESPRALLEALERSERELRTFSSSVSYRTEDALLGQSVLRKGSLIYTRPEPGGPRTLAILFDTQVEGGRLREQRKHYIFAANWLVEVDHERRVFFKREIAPPNTDFDPLKLGEGPFPLPFGQPPQEVLDRFDVTFATLPESGLLAKLDAATVDGLRLVPKPGLDMAEKVAHVDLFYDRATRLPVGVLVVEKNGNRKTARLDGFLRNPTLTPEQTARLSVDPPKPEGWRIEIDRWKGE